ncbi:hypothetical protein E2P81_ATG08198 [Venturia nashicola]|uniref:Uncharacterized protein n=1 Tax=Venturia nashicola TaxID=86259 RepID=A0A4Z1NVQ5_9PEZI|nr:hypothetical protein E6O75_ATG08380 [Venturia nashicola]TLD21610.1 hypothetical protein E2P81_ATG08198 [Venturia nashicola]
MDVQQLTIELPCQEASVQNKCKIGRRSSGKRAWNHITTSNSEGHSFLLAIPVAGCPTPRTVVFMAQNAVTSPISSPGQTAGLKRETAAKQMQD